MTPSDRTQTQMSDHRAGDNPKLVSVFTLIFVLLIFGPLGILGAAINWPQNLGEDADHNLPLLLDERPSVFWGYFIYLLYSILFFPVGTMVSGIVASSLPEGQSHPIHQIGKGFAGLSALTRSIGLSRWLFAMPTLARMYEDPASNEVTRAAIRVSYELLNKWGGGIGELLGVSMFAALWVFCTSILFILSPTWPSWMGYCGFLVAIDLALNLLEMSILGYDMGINLTLAVVFLHAWMFFAVLLFLQCCKCLSCMRKNESEEEE